MITQTKLPLGIYFVGEAIMLNIYDVIYDLQKQSAPIITMFTEG